MRTPSTGVLILLAAAGLALCATIGWVTATGTASGDVPLEVTARVLMIGLPIAVGLFAWSQPSSARFGRQLTLTGFVYFLAMLSGSADEVVYSAGRVAGTVTDVWIDRAESLIRYHEVALRAPAGRSVLLPATFSRIDFARKKIDVDAILGAQFAGAPTTRDPDRVTMLEEDRITAYFGAGTLYATRARTESLL